MRRQRQASLCDTAVLYEELGRGLPGRSSARVLGLMLLEAPRPSSARALLPAVARGERILAVGE